MAKERALDVFQLLSRIDAKDYEIWETLTEEQRKEFSPLVVMRWMAGMYDPVQLIFLNEIVNPSVFALGEANKDFLLKLLTVCSNGRPKRYAWVKYNVASKRKSRRALDLVAAHYRLSLREAEDSLPLFSTAELLELAEIHGLQKDEVTELKKELTKEK